MQSSILAVAFADVLGLEKVWVHSDSDLSYGYFDRSGAQTGVEMLGAGLTGEDLAMVPEHWFSFPAPPASAHTALALLYIFFTAAALLGNGLVIFIFSTLVSFSMYYFLHNLFIIVK